VPWIQIVQRHRRSLHVDQRWVKGLVDDQHLEGGDIVPRTTDAIRDTAA
jgi:hypothetical protein